VHAGLVLDVGANRQVGEEVAHARHGLVLRTRRQILVEVGDVEVVDAGSSGARVSHVPDGLRDAAAAEIPVRQVQPGKALEAFAYEFVGAEVTPQALGGVRRELRVVVRRVPPSARVRQSLDRLTSGA